MAATPLVAGGGNFPRPRTPATASLPARHGPKITRSGDYLRETTAPKGGRNAHQRERYSAAHAHPQRQEQHVDDNSPAPEATGLLSWAPSSRTRLGALHPRRRD